MDCNRKERDKGKQGMNRIKFFEDNWRKHVRALIDHFKDGDDSPLTRDEIIEITDFIKTELVLSEQKNKDFPIRKN